MWLALAPAAVAEVDLERLLRGVEDRYNRPKTMQVLFDQSYSFQGRRRTESGVLYLRKPGRMRWEYHSPGMGPSGKLFLCDGKDIWFYNPAAQRVEKSRLRQTEDLRAPLAFLMGRLDFRRDFREFRTRAAGEETNIVALPRSERSPYRQVEFTVSASFQIRKLVITGQDSSVMEFALNQERLDPPLDETLFQFRVPAGAELVEVAEGVR